MFILCHPFTYNVKRRRRIVAYSNDENCLICIIYQNAQKTSSFYTKFIYSIIVVALNVNWIQFYIIQTIPSNIIND